MPDGCSIEERNGIDREGFRARNKGRTCMMKTLTLTVILLLSMFSIGETANNTAKDQKGVQNKENDKNKRLAFFDKNKPVNIVSDTMEGFDKEKYVLFKGSVIAKQEDLYISADTVEAYWGKGRNEIEKAIAKGNVKIVKLDRIATCREAIFENVKGEITLKGDVVVHQGKDKLSGDVIIYYLNADRLVVQADKGKEARLTVQPK